jgi:hypothetical protein
MAGANFSKVLYIPGALDLMKLCLSGIEGVY